MRYILGLCVFALGANAHGSECSPKSPEAIALSAEVAFVGKVLKVEESGYKPWDACWDYSIDSPKCGGKRVTFEIEEMFRGPAAENVSVLSEDGCYCTGQYWDVGKSYLVVAKPNTTTFVADLVASNVCGGTGDVQYRTPEIEALRSRNVDG